MTKTTAAPERGAKAPEVCAAVGGQVMDQLNNAVTSVATMGHTEADGTYEFTLGPVYLPRPEASLTAPVEGRRLFVNLRLEDQKRTEARRVHWMCKRGDDYTEVPQAPAQAIVIDSISADPGEDTVYIRYHNSARA